jgi:4-amino-4-deoxy-L-arabinose transferase-like glycosyltransferase
MTLPKTPRAIAAVIAITYLLLALLYGLANPPFESTDEIRHFRYVRYLTLNGELPPISVEASGQLQAHHPPLYYTLAAILTAPIPSTVGPDYSPPINPFWGFRYYEPSNDNKAQYLHAPDDRNPFSSGTTLILYIARWLSTLFGLGVVLMAYRLGKIAFPDKPVLALGTMAFTAFSPTMLHSASSVNNDAAVAFFGAWAIVEAAAVAQGKVDRWQAVRLGLALGLGILSKASAVVLLALPVMAYCWVMLKHKRDWRLEIRDWGVAMGICAMVCGWWFARNYMASGDLMGLSDYQSAWAGEADGAQLMGEAISQLPYAWSTIWGRFDYGQVVMPQWVYILWAVISGVVLVGLVRARKTLANFALSISVLGLLLALAGWGVLMVTIPATAHARHILYAYPVIGLLFTQGWVGLWPSKIEDNRLSYWMTGFGLIQFVLSLFALFGYLYPAFAYPRTVASPPADATPTSANFESAAEIVGYQVAEAAPKPGEAVEVTVFWKPLAQTATPLQVFVHLVDDDGIIAAQRDTYPGLGNAVTTTWQVNQIFADTYRVVIPETADAPHLLTVRVGLWNRDEGRPLVVNESDAVALGTFQLNGTKGQSPLDNEINFAVGDDLHLVGYSLDRRVLKAGETFQLQTYWRIDRPLDIEYLASAHVVGGDGQIWGLADSFILPFTTQWVTDTVNGETRPITLDSNTPPGQYVLQYGIFRADENTQYRLPIIGPDGQGLGDSIELTRLRVEP